MANVENEPRDFVGWVNHPPKNQRVYVILHELDEKSGKRRVLLGKERFVHQKAWNEFLVKLGGVAVSPAAVRQLGDLRTLLREKKSILHDNGQLKAYGPFAGGNFGGLLLIGRTTLPGGRMEYGDRSLKKAAIRELKEEFQLHHLQHESCDAIRVIENALKPLIQLQRGQITEYYYTLDASEVSENPFFQCLYVLDLETIEYCFERDDADCEKRNVFICDADEMVAHFDDAMSDEDEREMCVAMRKLAHDICISVLSMENEPDCEEHLANEFMRFQKSRNMKTTREACEAFVKKFGTSN